MKKVPNSVLLSLMISSLMKADRGHHNYNNYHYYWRHTCIHLISTCLYANQIVPSLCRVHWKVNAKPMCGRIKQNNICYLQFVSPSEIKKNSIVWHNLFKSTDKYKYTVQFIPQQVIHSTRVQLFTCMDKDSTYCLFALRRLERVFSCTRVRNPHSCIMY